MGKGMSLRGWILVWATTACMEVAAAGQPVGKAEADFMAGCGREPSGCAFTRLVIHPDQGFSRVDHLVFNLDAGAWSALRRDSDVFWQAVHECADTGKAHIGATLMRDDRPGVAVPVRQARTGLYCLSVLDSSALEAANPGSGMRLSIRYSLDRMRSVHGRTHGVVPFFAGMRSRLLVINGGDHPLWLDGPSIDGGLVRGPISGGTVVDAPGASRVEGDTLRYSTFQGWDEFARAYGERESAMLGAQPGAPMGVEHPAQGRRERIQAVVAGLSRRLTYAYTQANAGGYPRRTPSSIRKSGYADCKDFSLLLADELRQHGIEAVSVITGTTSPAPPSLVVAGFEWADHVLVWIPSEQLFVDMTAGAGREMLGPASAVFGHLGFEVASGQTVVIR